MIELKISYDTTIDNPDDLEKLENCVLSVDDNRSHIVKLSTNNLKIRRDRIDDRLIDALCNIKMVFEAEKGCIILIGNLSCSHRQPYGGEFYAKFAIYDESLDFEAIKGVKEEVYFSNNPLDNNYFREWLDQLKDKKGFIFDISQFDEFMDIFRYYKDLSSFINNNENYLITDTSSKYYFCTTEIKQIENISIEDIADDVIVNESGIIIGYKISNYRYQTLDNSTKDIIDEVVDIKIEGTKNDVSAIKKFKEDLYISDEKIVDERNTRTLNPFELINVKYDENSNGKGTITLTGIPIKDNVGRYLHLYDMGQKAKLESINESLNLIKKGSSSMAWDLLQYIIGDEPIPNSKEKRPKQEIKKYIEGLDDSQQEAFLMAIDGSPVSVIKGPPGTGKTHVINAIVQYIVKELKEKVIISSQTHVAIDNVLDKLMSNSEPIIPNRITNRRNKYSVEEIDSTIYKTWGRNFLEINNKSRYSILKKRIEKDMSEFRGEKKFSFSESMDINEYDVIGATTTTTAIAGKKGTELFKGYDWLIIDEVSKCPITEILRYLPYVSKIIMVGDDFQLAPLFEIEEDDVKNCPIYDKEKFERLKKIYEDSIFAKTLQKASKSGRLVTLNVNYRSVDNVLKIYNIFYNNELKGRRDKINPNKVVIKGDGFSNNKDVYFVDVKFGKEANEGTSRFNTEEIKATKIILEQLMRDVENPNDVTISAIFPYAAQIEKFENGNRDLINNLKKNFKSFEIDTVDAFQGRETDIVLVNTVVTDPTRPNFLRDFRRINVSMSRAKDKLIIFGNPTTLQQINMSNNNGINRRFFDDIIREIRRSGQMMIFQQGELTNDQSKIGIKIK